MSIKAVIFDLDGTLLDTITDITKAMNLALSHFSLPGFTEEQYKFLVGSGQDRLVDGVLPKGKFNKEMVDGFVGKFRDYYNLMWRDNSVPFKGIKEILIYLKEKEIKQAVLSNKPHLNTVAMIEELLPGYFDIIYGERLAYGYPKKPDPTVALIISNELGVLPEEVLFIGDSDVDMQVAVNAGMIAVGALWGFRTKEELLENGANYLVSNPNEIKEIIALRR